MSVSDSAPKESRGLSLSRKALLIICVPVAFQIVLLFALFGIDRAHDRDREANRRNKDAIASGYRLLGLLVDAETGVRGYALTGNPSFTQPYDRAIVEFPKEIAQLRELVASGADGVDDRGVAELENLAAPVLAFERSSIDAIRNGRRTETIATISEQGGKRLMDRFRAGMDEFISHQLLVNAQREQAASRSRQVIEIALAVGGLINVALAFCLAIFFTRSITRRVQVVIANVQNVERNLALHERVGGTDEIAELDRRLHAMGAALREADEQWRRAEADLRRFFTVSLEMLCIAGFDGHFKLLNPVWERVLGHSLADLYERPFIDFVHPDDREATIAEAQKLAAGNLTIRFENRYRCVDGSYRWLLWNAVALPEEQKIFAAASDITDRKQFESTLQDRAMALETANRELEAFSYSVSHDLRSPLRAIDGYARIFEEDYAGSLDDEGRRLLSVIRGEARRMGILIDDLLAFSQVGRRPLSANAVDLGRMASDIIADKRRRYPDRQINFVARDAPMAHADSNAIRHVVFNLIANAVKYSKPEAAVDIEFGGRADGDHNLYWVADHGIGFDMRYADKIFGVFQRLHTNDRIEGSGVGLAIVQRVVERHGGRVWAESEIGKGSTFFFTLPFAQNQIENAEIANERSGNPAG
ncbi:MAG TPA: ATP-binding protein [Gemmatimonadaceae bacterium]|jgi:PAS domain S-box-containing protein